MARPGYEADRQVLMLRDLASGTVRPLTQAWDRSVGSIEWAKDGKSLLVTAEDTLEQPIFRIDAASGAVTRLTRDGHYGNVRALPRRGDLRDDEQHHRARRSLRPRQRRARRPS